MIAAPARSASVQPDGHHAAQFVSRCVRPAAELRRIDRILSHWTDDERLHGIDSRGIARLLEICAGLERKLMEQNSG
jgi:hypothetical protein